MKYLKTAILIVFLVTSYNAYSTTIFNIFELTHAPAFEQKWVGPYGALVNTGVKYENADQNNESGTSTIYANAIQEGDCTNGTFSAGSLCSQSVSAKRSFAYKVSIAGLTDAQRLIHQDSSGIVAIPIYIDYTIEVLADDCGKQGKCISSGSDSTAVASLSMTGSRNHNILTERLELTYGSSLISKRKNDRITYFWDGIFDNIAINMEVYASSGIVGREQSPDYQGSGASAFVDPTFSWDDKYNELITLSSLPEMDMVNEFQNNEWPDARDLSGYFDAPKTEVPEPPAFAIFVLGIIALVSHRFKKQS